MGGLSCVREDELRAFLLGEATDARLQAIARHLETCPDCEATASRLDGVTDAVVRSLRRVLDRSGSAATRTVSLPHSKTPGGETLGAGKAKNGPLPENLAGYELLGELGRGGMGVVYKARQLSLNRLVALKMMLAGAHSSPGEVDRFRCEAETVARLRHPPRWRP